LDELKGDREEEEVQAIIQDEKGSPSDKAPTEGRVAERNEEFACLQNQISARERRGLSWNERCNKQRLLLTDLYLTLPPASNQRLCLRQINHTDNKQCRRK